MQTFQDGHGQDQARMHVAETQDEIFELLVQFLIHSAGII